MSLKIFHVFFIVLSALLGLLLGGWSLSVSADPIFTTIGFSLGAMMLLYCIAFISKSRKLV